MNTDKYKYILAIAEHRSFSRAAESLFVSQPYLSKVVAETEKELGVRIFSRDHTPLTVTAAGECYIEYLKTVLHANQQMLAQLHDINRHSFGKIQLGIGSTHCSYLMPDVLRRFGELYPQVTVRFSECSNKTMIEHVENGILDFALYAAPKIPANLGAVHLKNERLLFVFPSNYPVKERFAMAGASDVPILSQNDFYKLAGEQFIVLTEHQGIGQFLREIFEQYHFTPASLYEVRNMETAYRLAAAGFGITIIPEICRRFLSFKTEPLYFQIGDPPLSRDIVVLFKKGRVLSAPEKSLCEIIQSLA